MTDRTDEQQAQEAILNVLLAFKGLLANDEGAADLHLGLLDDFTRKHVAAVAARLAWKAHPELFQQALSDTVARGTAR